ncbi:LEF-3 [Betabaculovirus altermyunipunctae]|uniref:LEF-3 n=1 Tax=Betabaculovirus altermyunipunctae TaxID=3051996 RepID=A0A1S5YE73_9BBAC|nr:LEF-3 [Betabaculovirus altermyunipunctae]AQQ80386.1 LEF-3 [Betabaculovirus altermyunipunctae]
MTKRAAECLDMGSDSNKMARVENEKPETVMEKKCWRINNKDMYRIIARYENQTLDRSVLNKEVYDKLTEGSTYKFTYQKHNRVFYIVSFEEIEACSGDGSDIKLFLTQDDFNYERNVNLYAYVVCAYELRDYNNGKFSMVKVCTVVKRDEQYVQCDLIINLNTVTTFDVGIHDDNATRVTKVFTNLFQLRGKWCTVSATCNKTTLREITYYKLLLRPHTEIAEAQEFDPGTIDDQCCNISYLNKIFKCIEVKTLRCTLNDYVSRFTNKPGRMIKLNIETVDGQTVACSAFLNNQKQEECMDSLQTVDMNVASGEKVYAIIFYKQGDDAYNLCSVQTYSAKDNDFYSLYC